MSFTFTGDRANQRVYVQIDSLEELTRRAIRHGWFTLGKDLRQTASKEILRRPKSGRVYRVRGPSGRRRRHVASAPGETHANLTGAARRSLGWVVTGSRSMEWGYGVDKSAPEYVKHLEFGTKRMAARPSLQNAMDAVHRNSKMYFGKGFTR